jgi:hypothetical protein
MTLVRCKFHSLWRMIEHCLFAKLSDIVCWCAQLAAACRSSGKEEGLILSQAYYTSASFRAVLE